MQGANESTVEQVRSGRVPQDAAPDKQELFRFVEKLTVKPGDIEQRDIEELRSVGWNDEAIAEATYITALFAFFNRVASAFGLEDPRYAEKLAKGDGDVPAAHQKPVELD